MKEKKKSKKALKIILCVILILLVGIIAIKLYGLNLMLKISDSIYNYKNSSNFSYRIIQEISPQNTEIIEIIRKDNIFVTKQDYNSENIYVSWYDLTSTNKYYNSCEYNLPNSDNQERGISYSKKDIENITYLNDGILYTILDLANFKSLISRLDINEKIELFISSLVVCTEEYEGKDCYTYKIWGEKFYIDKETLLPIAETYGTKDTIYPRYKIEYDIEYDENLLKEPDFNEFETYGFFDNVNDNANYDEFSQKSISGTNLDPTENLIENVALKENESLDILPITEDSFGVKSVEIHCLETYNKFREDYSNLRELTEEDFEYYKVTIAYKKGYELTFSNYQETNESYNLCYIFTEKETEKDNIVLIITPRAQKDNVSIVISNEEIKVTTDQIFEIYFQTTKELEKELGFEENSLYCNNDRIIKLKKDVYEKLDYVKTPIKGEAEPVCWAIQTSVYQEKNNYINVITYINAITGEVIGARYIRNNN